MTVQAHMAWQYRNPADLIGRRCIALTGLHVIDCDLRHHTNKTSDGIRAVVITEGKP